MATSIAKKFALVSAVLPPYSSGQAVMIHRILEPLPAEQYCLMSCFRPEILVSTVRATRELPGKTYHLRSFSHPEKMVRSKLALLTEPWRYAADILYRAMQMWRNCRNENVTTLIVCSGEFGDIAAGYLVSRFSRIKLVPYMFDYFSYQQTGIFRRVATWLERQIVKRAPANIVPNEFMGMELQKTYGASSTIIRNPCIIPPLPSYTHKHDGFVIVYTGAVYSAQYDAMARLVKALDHCDDANVTLHIYTTQTASDLAQHSITGPHVTIHPHLKQEEIPAVQAAADLLFLPLSFEATYDVLIKTSAPGKMGEYMAIGQPILAHVPKDSFVEWYVTKHNTGRVVTSTNVADLSSALQEFIDNPKLARQLGSNGRKMAERDYALPVVQKNFCALAAADFVDHRLKA